MKWKSFEANWHPCREIKEPPCEMISHHCWFVLHSINQTNFPEHTIQPAGITVCRSNTHISISMYKCTLQYLHAYVTICTHAHPDTRGPRKLDFYTRTHTHRNKQGVPCRWHNPIILAKAIHHVGMAIPTKCTYLNWYTHIERDTVVTTDYASCRICKRVNTCFETS